MSEPDDQLDQTTAASVVEDGEEDGKPSKWKSSRALFVLALAGLAAVYFMYLKTGPSKAAAAPEAAAAKTTINSFLKDGSTNVKGMERSLRETEKIVQQFLSYPSVKQVPVEDLKSNPFRQQAALKTEAVDEVAARKRKEEQRQAALKAVQGLQLQSVLVSDKNRSCMINNSLFLEGQTVDQFLIEQIAPGSVIVKNGVYRFELRMAK